MRPCKNSELLNRWEPFLNIHSKQMKTLLKEKMYHSSFCRLLITSREDRRQFAITFICSSRVAVKLWMILALLSSVSYTKLEFMIWDEVWDLIKIEDSPLSFSSNSVLNEIVLLVISGWLLQSIVEPSKDIFQTEIMDFQQLNSSLICNCFIPWHHCLKNQNIRF